MAVLGVLGRDGLPRVIVGGQAVNVWAERYLPIEPDLAEFLPFTSRDLDLLGERRDLDELARLTGFARHPAPRKVFIPSAGFLELPYAGGGFVKVEVLKRVHGLLTEDLVKSALLIERGAVRLRVTDPITLLQAKTENAVHLPQQDRQDVKHLHMMVLCVRGFIREQIVAVSNGDLTARGCLDSLERIIQIASTRTASSVTRMYGIRWLDSIPIPDLLASRSTKLRNFVEKRLPRWREQLGRKK